MEIIIRQGDYLLRSRFHDLKDKWLRDTVNYSSVEDIFNHPTGQIILANGRDFTPYILEEIANSPYRWIAALQIITDENPVQEEHFWDINSMMSDWKAWGENR